jgi:cystathionine beta-lyase
VAALAAYKHGEEWRLQLMDYLRGNHELVLNEINSIKGLKMAPLEATYLAWIDTRESETKNIVSVLEDAGVGVMDASMFGSEGFIRLNFGTQRSLLEEGIKRIKKALS